MRGSFAQAATGRETYALGMDDDRKAAIRRFLEAEEALVEGLRPYVEDGVPIEGEHREVIRRLFAERDEAKRAYVKLH